MIIREQVQKYSQSLPKIPYRKRTMHKGNFGTVLGIGGSRGMAGAIALAGRAALLAGAGLVRLAVPDMILETVAGFYPELTTLPCKNDFSGCFCRNSLESLWKHASTVTAVFLGPGLGRSEELNQFTPEFLKQISCPVVIDADALNALAASQISDQKIFCTSSSVVIITPHSGEFARLRGEPTPDEEHPEERIKSAIEFAQKQNVILVLKGHETIITDGSWVAQNPTGNPGMATGGSGDVLTGMLAAMLAQGFTPEDSARLAVFLHGLAGDIAAQNVGETSVTASTLLDKIPEAFLMLNNGFVP